jgi:predicted nucleic acid-binding protein
VIFVDTSIWVAFLRGRDAALVARVRSVLDDQEVVLAAPVRIEILSGASRRDLPKLARLLEAFRPTDATWKLIEVWLDRAVRVGQRFGAMDLLIGAIAAEQNATIWSLDRDFERMERLGFVQRYTPAD